MGNVGEGSFLASSSEIFEIPTRCRKISWENDREMALTVVQVRPQLVRLVCWIAHVRGVVEQRRSKPLLRNIFHCLVGRRYLLESAERGEICEERELAIHVQRRVHRLFATDFDCENNDHEGQHHVHAIQNDQMAGRCSP